MSEIKGDNYTWLGGRLKYQALDHGSKKTKVVGYYPDKQPMFEYFLRDRELEGLCKDWYENGQLKSEKIFSSGRMRLSREWFPNGNIQSEEVYKDGRILGFCKTWYENGQLASHGFYREYMREGVFTYLYPDGKLKSQEKYENWQLHGVSTYWDENGKVLEKKIFVRGVLITNKIHKLLNTGALTAQHILKINNQSVRRICLEELGYSKFLSQLPHVIIDKDRDQELVKIDWHKREKPIYLVKVKCPSTGAFYTLRVPPSMKTVKQAVAWTFGVTEKEYDPQAET